MTTEIFITTPRLGTISITSGGTAITGTGTDFTSADIGKVIIVRTTAGDMRAVIDSVISATSADVVSAWTTTQSGCYFYIDYQTLDLYNDFPYSLNYKIADIRNPEARDSSYSKTIKLPGTDANNIIFDNIFEVNLEGSFNPNIRAFVIVYQNYIPVFNGNLQLLKVYRDYDKIEYDVAIFGKIGDLFQKVADKLLTDLDLSDLDETGTASHITTSWSAPSDLFYPYLDNGRQNISTATPAYISDQIAPAILVSRVFEEILSSVGYTCADTATLYSETNMDKLYIPCLKNWRRRVYINFGIRAKYTAVGFTGDLSLVIERVRTATTESIFVGAIGDTYSNLTYQTTIELDYGDVLYFQVEGDASNIGASSLVENVGANSFLQISYLDTEFNYNVNGYNNLALVADITQVGAGGAGTLKKIQYDLETSDVNNTWSVDHHTVPVKHTQGFLPDNYKQRDFLLALIKMFNLYLEPVFDNDTQINILPRDTYYSQGGVVDWTTKLDVGQPIEITPMGELDWKEYLFSLKEDADFWNKDYKAKTFENYGQRTVIVENDFIATKKSIIPEIAPFPLRQSAYNSLVLSNCIKDGVSTIPNIYTGILRVIYYDANTTTGATTLDGVAKATYPFCGHLIGTPQVPTFDFNYAAPRSVYYTLNDPTLYPISSNLYTSFWQNFIEEISDKYSKIVTAYFNLTSEDIRTLDFRDSYFVDGTYYRLNKVIDFSPIGNTLTKVELIKIRDAVFIPSDSFSHGNVDLTTVSVGTPPYISTEVLEGQIIAGDAQGLGVAQTMSQDAIIDSSARVTVKGLRGREIQDAAPSNGDVYQWVAANSRWEPTAGGGGSGDVVGPASAIADDIAVFNGTTGKLIKDGGKKISDLLLNPLTTKGDTIYEDATPTPARLPIGNEKQILTVESGLPVWKDAPVFGSLNYFWTVTASAVAGYYKQLITPYSPLTAFSTAGVINGQLLRTYITETNNPNRTFIPAGEYTCHIHAAKTAGTKDAYLYVEIWETDSAGTDIAKIATLGTSTILTGVNAEYFIGFTTPQYTLASVNSRIATKVYATISGGGSAPTIALYVGGTSDSRTNLPATAIDISLYVPYTGATSDFITAQNINLSAETASTIASFDASKNVKSLALATYPSLTELSYVKGVTSAIQTQLGLLAPLASPTFTGNPTAPTPAVNDNDTSIATTAFVTAADIAAGYTITKTTTDNSVTGSTAETLLFSFAIPANTLSAGSIIYLRSRCRKTSTNGTWSMRVRFHTSSAVAGSQMALFSGASNILLMQLERTFFVKTSTTVESYPVATTSSTDDTQGTGAVTTTTVDLTVALYVIVTIQLTSGSDTGYFSGIYLEIK